jgi:hypothetical protein
MKSDLDPVDPLQTDCVRMSVSWDSTILRQVNESFEELIHALPCPGDTTFGIEE